MSQQFPDTAVDAVQIAQTGEFLSDHLNKPGTYEYAALSAESVKKWDYVILQVRESLGPFSMPIDVASPNTCHLAAHVQRPTE